MQNWEIKKLGEVCEINIGRTPERGNFKMWDKEKKTENVWLSIADLNNTEKGYISDSTEYVSDNAVPKMKLVKANTLLMSFKLTIGRCAITKRDLFTNEAIAALPILDKNLDLFFLKYYLENFDWAKLTEGDVKVKGKTLNKEKLKEVPITLPPLEEQKRIVKILDEKFARLETVKANAKNNLQNAKDLFQSQLTKAFSNTTWEKKTLGDVITVLTDFNANGGYAKLDSNVKMYDEPNYAIMVRTTDLEKNDFENGVKYVDKKAYDMLSKSTIYGNEIIMNKIGSAGKIYLMPCLNRPATLARNAFMMRFVDEMDVRFLFSYLSSPEGTASIMKHVHGAVTKTITKDEVRSIQIPFTSLPEQKRIIEQLDSISQKVRSLEEICTKQLANCDELKQAFLAKAFAGEL